MSEARRFLIIRTNSLIRKGLGTRLFALANIYCTARVKTCYVESESLDRSQYLLHSVYLFNLFY